MLQLTDLSIGYGQHCLCREMDISLAPGQILCLLGRNGAGKTTLLKTLLGLQQPLCGQIRIAGQPLETLTPLSLAALVGYVPQSVECRFGFSVLDMVLMGCQPRLGLFGTPGRREQKRARQILGWLGLEALAAQPVNRISGGERQLVLIARALLQAPQLLVMDEPAASLDFGNQIRLLEQVKRLKQWGIAVVMSTHHPRHAELTADTVVTLERDGTARQGSGAQLLQPAHLAGLYGVSEDCIIQHMSGNGAGA